jgi:hypothetical protein
MPVKIRCHDKPELEIMADSGIDTIALVAPRSSHANHEMADHLTGGSGGAVSSCARSRRLGP